MTLGLNGARSPFVGVLNDDVVVRPDWAEHALRALESHADLGSVASKVLDAAQPSILASAGDHLAINGRATNIGFGEPDSAEFSVSRHVFSAAGACAVYRRQAFEAVGGFDPSFTAYLEDVDLGFRLQLAGHRCLYEPRAVAEHVGGATPKRRGYALKLTERNMVWNLLKNMPSGLIRRHAGSILSAQSRPSPVVGGNSWQAFSLGKAAAWSGAGARLRQRQRIQASRRVSDTYIEQLLTARSVESCHL